jgi:hypothetical protein
MYGTIVPKIMFQWQIYWDMMNNAVSLKLVVCILFRVLGQVQGFRLTQHCFE